MFLNAAAVVGDLCGFRLSDKSLLTLMLDAFCLCDVS